MDNQDNKPFQTFRDGAIGVSIWERDGSDGPFYEFTLSRSYKKSDTEAGYSACFREYNDQALVSVIGQAVAFIRQQDAPKKRSSG